MKPDLKNVLATFLGVTLTLTGAYYVHREFASAEEAYLARDVEREQVLEASNATIVSLQAELAAYKERQQELEEKLVVALEAAGQKEAADALEAERVEDEAEAKRTAQKQAAQAQTDAQAAADAQAKSAQEKAAADAKKIADAKAKEEADKAAKVLADAKAKAAADAAAKAAAEQNASKPSRRTSAS